MWKYAYNMIYCIAENFRGRKVLWMVFVEKTFVNCSQRTLHPQFSFLKSHKTVKFSSSKVSRYTVLLNLFSFELCTLCLTCVPLISGPLVWSITASRKWLVLTHSHVYNYFSCHDSLLTCNWNLISPLTLQNRVLHQVKNLHECGKFPAALHIPPPMSLGPTLFLEHSLFL